MASSPGRKPRYDFFLNPYRDQAFTRCPMCDGKTKQRELPLAIFVEPHIFCMLNKTCRFCPGCGLLIARRSQLDPLLASMFPDERAGIEAGEYTVFGTLDRPDWRAGQMQEWSVEDVAERVWPFKRHRDFEVRGWGPAEGARRK